MYDQFPGPVASRVLYFWRKNVRIIAITSIVTTFLYFSWTSTTILPSISPRLAITKSSYDWSRFEPFYPVESITPLPNQRSKKLAKIQHNSYANSSSELTEQRRDKIKGVMRKCWQSYAKFAWTRDELMPLTANGKDTFGGWSATLVDSLDTLYLMDLKDEFNQAVQEAVKLNWGNFTGGQACNMFETTIRYLGGLLGAYDLSREQALLDKAIELGDMLYAGFDTPNHMPGFWFSFSKAKTGNLIPDLHQAAASINLQMEFTHLAQLTGNAKYYDAVARVTDKLYAAQNQTSLPGMWPTFFELQSGIFTADRSYTLGASSDSMYEYILKTYALLGGTEQKYEQMYRTAANTVADYLLFRPMTPQNLDILFSGTYHDRPYGNAGLDPEGQHLACFAGGFYALGGKIFSIPEHVKIGERLTKGCIWAYNAFPAGIAPENFKLVPCNSTAGCEWDEQLWRHRAGIKPVPKGFENARDPRYLLRPEALESVFVLYRITGNEEYREAAWRMFEAIQKATETPFGNAAITDVTALNPKQIDSMESFWMAETLKYLYLIFSPPDLISLDDFVFNTEAHPFRIAK